MDPRDPEAWNRQDSQNGEASFAERKEDPWKCESGKSHGSGTGTGIVIAGTSTSSGTAEAAKVPEHEGKAGKSVEDAINTAENPNGENYESEDIVGDDVMAPLIDGALITTRGGRVEAVATALEPKVTVVPIGNDVPTPTPAPAFSTVGFWEAQEAAKAGASSGGSSFGNYGTDTAGSSNGWGNDSSGYGDSGASYGGGGDMGWGNEMNKESAGWGESGEY
jgi:hypothetical protein